MVTKMKLSEAIRRGCATTEPVADGFPFEFNTEGQATGACAIGAAYLGACGPIRRTELEGTTGQAQTDFLVERLNDVLAVDLDAPASVVSHGQLYDMQPTLAGWVWYTNDSGSYSREWIADKLSELGL